MNLEVARPELVCYTSLHPSSGIQASSVFLFQISSWWQNGGAAVAITSTFHLAELASFRQLSRKPRPVPPSSPGRLHGRELSNMVSAPNVQEFHDWKGGKHGCLARGSGRLAAWGTRSAAPVPLRPLPTPFPVLPSSARMAPGRGAHGVSYVSTRSLFAWTRGPFS